MDDDKDRIIVELKSCIWELRVIVIVLLLLYITMWLVMLYVR
jgi:hypothetical protein